MTANLFRTTDHFKEAAMNELDAIVVSRFNGNPKMLSPMLVREWIDKWVTLLGRDTVQEVYLTVARSQRKMDVATVRARRK